jgi:hypothetical protein
MKIMIKIIVITAIIILLALLIKQQQKTIQPTLKKQNQQFENMASVGATTTQATAASTPNNPGLYSPISEVQTRVSKKPFGLYVSPNSSPVSPEHFIGYHTGVDFETTPQEQNIDVPVQAICAGPLVLKKTATGYGGVAVQSCEIDYEPVTIIYGHLRLASITATQNTLLNQGQQIGILGKGYSAETAGERKHLHLGIHKSSMVNLLGYVSTKDKLNQWIDFLTLIK